MHVFRKCFCQRDAGTLIQTLPGELETLEHTSLNEMSPSNPPLQGSGNSVEEEAEGEWKSEGMSETRKTKPPRSNENSSYELTKTEAAGTGTTWFSTKSSVCIYTEYI